MLKDLVLETASNPGTSAVNLAGPPAGRIGFLQAFATGATCFYFIDDGVQEEWGIGTLTAGSPNILARTTVLGNSAGTTARLNFTGAVRVYNDVPSARSLYFNADQTLSLQADPTSPLHAVTMQYADASDQDNLLNNSHMLVQQRGAGPFTAAGYTLDQWIISVGTGGGSRSVTAVAATDTDRANVGSEDLITWLQYAATGGAGTGDAEILAHRIERVSRTAGKQVTVSFDAAGAGVVSVGAVQNFGTGGSPSSPVIVPAVQVVTTAAAARYSVTLTIPSRAGKTLGTGANDYLEIDIYLSAGSALSAAAGSLGQRTQTIKVSRLMCYIGTAAGRVKMRDDETDLARCQRYYALSYIIATGYNAAGASVDAAFSLPVTMRTAPTISAPAFSAANCTVYSFQALGGIGGYANAVTGSAGGWVINCSIAATAEL